MQSYALIFNYSFDSDVAVYLFDTMEEAQDTLMSALHEEVRIAREENGWDTDYEVSAEHDYAKIITHFLDRDDVEEFRIGCVYRWCD